MLWKETWGAGESKTFFGTFEFFRLLKTPGGVVDVTLMRNGAVISENIGIEGGFWERFPKGFPCDGVIIKSASAQTIQFATRVASEVGFDIQSLVFPSKGVSTFTQAAASVGTASATLLAANANRSYLAIQNNDSTAIYINLTGAAATTANGIKINPGSAWVMDTTMPVGAITAIAAVAATAIVVIEA